MVTGGFYDRDAFGTYYGSDQAWQNAPRLEEICRQQLHAQLLPALPGLATKIVSMLLEHELGEILQLCKCRDTLKSSVQDALCVLREAGGASSLISKLAIVEPAQPKPVAVRCGHGRWEISSVEEAAYPDFSKPKATLPIIVT